MCGHSSFSSKTFEQEILFWSRCFFSSQDKDSALSPAELRNLFCVCPYMPWGAEVYVTVPTTDEGYISNHGYLCQWTLVSDSVPDDFVLYWPHALTVGTQPRCAPLRPHVRLRTQACCVPRRPPLLGAPGISGLSHPHRAGVADLRSHRCVRMAVARSLRDTWPTTRWLQKRSRVVVELYVLLENLNPTLIVKHYRRITILNRVDCGLGGLHAFTYVLEMCVNVAHGPFVALNTEKAPHVNRILLFCYGLTKGNYFSSTVLY